MRFTLPVISPRSDEPDRLMNGLDLPVHGIPPCGHGFSLNSFRARVQAELSCAGDTRRRLYGVARIGDGRK